MTPPDAEITELPSSPGARLRRERESRGMNEQQAAEALNLDPAVLACLESSDFNALGAPVFVKGHLRRYAALLGLPEDEILAAYERSKQHVDEPTLVPKARLEMLPERNRPRWPWVIGGAVAFLLAAAGVAYFSENGLPWQERAATEATVTESVAPADGRASQAQPVVESAPAPATQSDLTPQADLDAATAAASDATQAAPGAFSSGGSAADSAAGAAAPSTPATALTTPPAAPPLPGQVSLQLRFAADSWVEVFDGSGKAVVFELGKAGTERSLTATAPLSVTLGNSPGVTVSVNGRTQVPPGSGGQSLVRFSVAPDGSLR